MALPIDALSDKEKQTLRLLVSGHDAKSMARLLGLSVHTVNERLREARRKLSVSSSRQAARLLQDAEAAPPNSLVDKHIGDAVAVDTLQSLAPSDPGSASWRRPAWIMGGLTMIVFLAGLLALASAPDATAPAATATAQSAAAESDASQAARRWLALVDASKWSESWAATGSSFRKHNTVANWQSASDQARVPLGAALSRDLTDNLAVPAPPSGEQVIRFRTRFANRAQATETVALLREDGDWKVAGYYID